MRMFTSVSGFPEQQQKTLNVWRNPWELKLIRNRFRTSGSSWTRASAPAASSGTPPWPAPAPSDRGLQTSSFTRTTTSSWTTFRALWGLMCRHVTLHFYVFFRGLEIKKRSKMWDCSLSQIWIISAGNEGVERSTLPQIEKKFSLFRLYLLNNVNNDESSRQIL